MKDRSYHDFDTAQPLLTRPDMHIRTTALFKLAGLAALTGLFACGQVNFGSPLAPSEDTGPTPDVDSGIPVVVPDTGFDSGVVQVIDAGCQPVALPTALPDVWPFEDDVDTYQAVFLDWAQGEACTVCHDLARFESAARANPLIVRDNELGRFADSRDQIWDLTLRSSQRVADLTGPLWRHSEGHPERQTDITYSPEQTAFLEDFIAQAMGCQIPAFIAAQDAGSTCRGEGVDGGVPGAPLCYCDEQPDAGPIDNQYCAQ
ncbi:MAG: hypothetical protein AAF449_18770 [Myxococcota bacterium]